MSEAVSETLVQDERVLVTKWALPPGAQTGGHTHGLDYLVVYLTDGVLTVEANGQTVEVPVFKHKVTSRAAGIAHNVLNRSSKPVEFSEIELKR